MERRNAWRITFPSTSGKKNSEGPSSSQRERLFVKRVYYTTYYLNEGFNYYILRFNTQLVNKWNKREQLGRDIMFLSVIKYCIFQLSVLVGQNGKG